MLRSRGLARWVLMRKKFIYIIASELGFVKIGVAVDVAKRLRQLNAASPVELSIYAQFLITVSRYPQNYEPSRSIESTVHRRLCNFRVKGEWFKLPPQDAAMVVQEVINAAPEAPLPRERELICPHCEHPGKTQMSNKEIWATNFRCSGCNKSVPGRRFFIRRVA